MTEGNRIPKGEDGRSVEGGVYVAPFLPVFLLLLPTPKNIKKGLRTKDIMMKKETVVTNNFTSNLRPLRFKINNKISGNFDVMFHKCVTPSSSRIKLIGFRNILVVFKISCLGGLY